ncbi:MAG: hypothetical protein J5J00_06630 [Deltaproteobacteria bacterium]|nr:hypothetical protein [Deltaproteobacteria bacterium]
MNIRNVRQPRRGPRANLYFLCITFLCQAIGAGTVALYRQCSIWINPLNPFPRSEWELYLVLLLHSVVAFFAARYINLPFIWQLFNLLIAPAIIVYPTLGLPQGFLLLVVVITVLLYLPTLWTRVPYYPTSKRTYRHVLDLIPAEKEFRVAELGCGFGGLMLYIARHRPLCRIDGYEISPLPFLISRFRVLLSRQKNITVYPKSFWNADFSVYQLVYAFLSPEPMEELWKKVKSEMKPASIFISNSFQVPAAPNQEIEIGDRRRCKLLIYHT